MSRPACYEVGNILQDTTGSKAEGITRGSYATVRSVDATDNRSQTDWEAQTFISNSD